MANNETRVIKTDTFEGWRQKSNEVSFELGDVDQLDSRILDKNYTYTATAGDALFTGTDTGSKALRFEEAPETVTDMLHVVIFTGSPTIPSNFVEDATATQSGGFSGKILWINTNKAAFSTVSGTFNAGENLTVSGQDIAHANLVRTVSESVKIGYVRVKQGGTELTQTQVQAGFHVPNYIKEVVLANSPTIPPEFTEGVTLTQSGGFSGVLLSADTTRLRFKSFTGSFSTGQNLGVPHTDADKRVNSADISSEVAQDASFGNIVELHTLATGSQAILVISNDAVDAINEVQDDVGDITALGTTDKADVVTAVNELETGIRGSSSSLIAAGLTTTANDLLAAVNEHDAELGTITSGAMGTDASTVSTAIAELETVARAGNANYTLTTTAPDFRSAINEHDAELGTISASAMGTTASTVGPAILELETEIDVLNARVEPTQAFAGSFTATTVMDALNEHETDIGSMSFPNSGTTIGGTSTSLTTALNALDSEIGSSTSYNDGTYGASTIAGTLDLLQAGMIANDTEIADRLRLNLDETTQVLTGTDRFIDIGDGTDDVTLRFKNNAVLDVSAGTTLFSAAGGVANFGSAFLNLDANLTTGMGLQVDRDHVTTFGTMTNHDVRLQWNEGIAHNGSSLINPEEAWQVIGMETDGTTNTTSLVTRYNAFNLIANNTESGIAVTWDATNENFDFNVNDPVITFTSGQLRTSGNLGQATITDLGNTTFALTANTLDLGYDEHIKLGGSDEFQIYNNNTSSILHSTDGIAILTDSYLLRNESNNENMITAYADGAVTLLHNGNSKIATTNTGVAITGENIVSDWTRTAGLRVATSGTDPGDGNAVIGNNLTVGNDLTVTGDLLVSGDTTTLNVSTLEVEDTLVMMGTAGAEPANTGFGLETRLFDGTSVHSNAADNVTGTHSLVYNTETSRWEADGSLILSSATQGAPKIEGQLFESNDNLQFSAGSGLTESVGVSGVNTTVTYTNDDKGSSQPIFKIIAAPAQSNIVADSNNDTLTVLPGSTAITITTNASTDTLTIGHGDTSSLADINNANGTVIQDLGFDTHGHVTSQTSVDLDGRYYTKASFTANATGDTAVIRDNSGNFSAGTITANLTGTASEASNAGTLDGHDSTVFLRSNTADSFTGSLTMGTQQALVASDYGHGTYGTYSATKFQHVWGMGTGYNMHASGDNLTGFYGLAYTHSNNTTDDAAGRSANDANVWSDSHQLLHVINGSVTAAVGEDIWTSGNYIGDGSLITSINASNIASGTISAARVPTLNQNTTGTAASAGTVTSIGDLTGDITSTNRATAIAAGVIVDADVSASAGIAYSKLGTIPTWNQSTTGNANTATTLATARNIHGQSFDGSANITIPSASVTSTGVTEYATITETNAASSAQDRAVTPYSLAGWTGHTGTGSNLHDNFQGSGAIWKVGTITSGTWSGDTLATSKIPNLSTDKLTSGTLPTSRGGTGNTTGTAALVTMVDHDGNASYPLVHKSNTNSPNFDSDVYMNASSNIVYATDFIASSDERQKDIIEPITGALDKVCAIDGFIYKWNDKAPSGDTVTRQVGVSAQDVQEVLPEAVFETEGGYLGVAYDKLIPLLVESIKELKSEVEELKSINSKDEG